LLLGSLLCSVHFGAFFSERFRTSFHDVAFDFAPADEERALAFRRITASIPPDASVSAGEYEGPQLARRRLLALKTGIEGADYVIYSRRSLRWGGDEEVERVLREGEYGVVDTVGDFTLLARDHATDENRRARRRLRR
jgi:hypothetical protein